jgi:23S rRNA maturation mini-RNase III
MTSSTAYWTEVFVRGLLQNKGKDEWEEMEHLRNVYVCKKKQKQYLRTITKGKFDRGIRSVVIKRRLNYEYFEV